MRGLQTGGQQESQTIQLRGFGPLFLLQPAHGRISIVSRDMIVEACGECALAEGLLLQKGWLSHCRTMSTSRVRA